MISTSKWLVAGTACLFATAPLAMADPGRTLPRTTVRTVSPQNKPAPEAVVPDYKHLAIAHQAKGMVAKAINEYQHAIELNPKDSGSHNNLAMALKDIGMFDAAAREERIAIKLKPHQSDYHYNLAIILQHQSSLKKAVGELKKAAQLNEADSEIHYRMAQVQLERQKPAEAELELRKALQLKPNRAQYLRLLGDALMLQDRDEDALTAYNQVVRLSKKPDSDLRNKIEFLTQRNSNSSHI